MRQPGLFQPVPQHAVLFARLMAYIFAVVVAVDLDQFSVLRKYVSGFHLQYQYLAVGRHHSQVKFTELLLVVMHGRPAQAVKHIKAVGQAVSELQQQILFAVISRSYGAAECFVRVNNCHEFILA